MSDNWIVANLENAFATWNDKMAEIWTLVTTSPQNFKGGTVWAVIQGINGGLQAIGLGLLVLFFAILPDFHGVSSWLSMASVLGLIGGSLQVAAYGEMWYRRKNRG